MNHVVWLANNLTHYHRARADAFARVCPQGFTVLELSNSDSFSALRSAPCEKASVRTLFPGQELQKLRRSSIRNAVIRFLDEVNPSVCCLNGWALPGTAVMLSWAIRHQVPCVLMSETNAHDSPSTWWKEAIKREFVAHCGAALVGGAWHRDYLTSLGMLPEKIFNGYDVVDNHHFQTGAEAARKDPGRTRASLNLPSDYFLACARFEPKKNLHRLIEGYGAYVRQIGPHPWKLVIAGDGPLRPELEELTKSQRFEDQVLFRGAVGYQELPAYYGLAKAFVHASTTEQWGLVVNEAMAAGLPVLVSQRCGCVSELVKDGTNGFTFDPGKVDEITEKLVQMHRDPLMLQSMSEQSLGLIMSWGPERFARNLQQAIQLAVDCTPRNRRSLSAVVVRLMAVH
jgi:glycosyltransferase involved in cell wall biosynthesis